MSLLPLYKDHVRKTTTLGRRPCVPVVSFAMNEVIARQLSCARTCESLLGNQDGMKLFKEDKSVHHITHRRIFAAPSEHEDGVST